MVVQRLTWHLNGKGAVGQNGIELRRLLQEPWFAITISGAAPRNYSVSQTMAEIRRRYEAIRAGVSEIDQLWVSVLPRVEAARTTLERLEGEARDLGVLEPLIGRARALAEELNVHFLGEVPLLEAIRTNADEGTPVVTDPAEQASEVFTGIAQDLVSQVERRNAIRPATRKIEVNR